MPELPEVETIRRTLLNGNILHNPVEKISLKPSRLVHASTSELQKFKKTIINQEFYQLERQGKYLFLIGKTCSLILHFGMSGVINWYPQSKKYEQKKSRNNVPSLTYTKHVKHEYLALYFKDGAVLNFIDPRTFGKIILVLAKPKNIRNSKYLSKKNKAVGHSIPSKILDIFYQHTKIGLDILTTPLNDLTNICIRKFSNSKRVIKNTLLDQSVISGVGNIYADESLFKTKISPLRKSCTLNHTEWKGLLSNIKAIFRQAINFGGSSISDYQKPNGLAGNFQSKFLVYGKEGENCPTCKIPLLKITLQKRTTIYCGSCQL